MKIEEVLGYHSSASSDAETITKRYYVQCTVNEGPNDAKAALEAFAKTLPVPANLELGDVTLDEEKNTNGLYFGTITFKNVSPQIKRRISADLFETFGEKMSEGRKSGSHERVFRIKSNSTGRLLRIFPRAKTLFANELSSMASCQQRNTKASSPCYRKMPHRINVSGLVCMA